MLPIILVNYNSTDETIVCIKSILQSTVDNYKIIIVDNKSFYSEYRKLVDFKNELWSTEKDKIVIINSNVNGGFAYGNNLGIQFCLNNFNDWEFIWILNNDTVIHPNTIQQILDYSSSVPKNCGIWGHLLLYLDNPSIIQAAGGKYNKFLGKGYNINAYRSCDSHHIQPVKVDYIIGASMVVRREFIKDVGMMNEEYFLFFEELDWIERGKKNGWIIKYNPSIDILHAHGGSTMKKDKNTNLFSAKCSFRSRILFTKKFHFPYLPFVLATCTISSIYKIVRGELKNGITLLLTSYKAVFSNSF